MKELLPLLEELAASLGTTVEHLWGILLKQAPISAVTDLMQYGLVATAIYFWIKVTKTTRDKISNRDLDEENWIWLSVGWLALAILTIHAFYYFPITITKIVNPEYWATMEILDKITPTK